MTKTVKELQKQLYNKSCDAFGQGKVWKFPEKGWEYLAHYVHTLLREEKIEELDNLPIAENEDDFNKYIDRRIAELRKEAGE